VFIQRIVITLPKVEIIGRPDVVLAVLQNKKAVRTDDAVLTAVGSWLPNTDDCENLKYAFMLDGYVNSVSVRSPTTHPFPAGAPLQPFEQLPQRSAVQRRL
jgi:hypothetical protein